MVVLYNARGHKLRVPALEKAQFVTVTGITTRPGKLKTETQLGY